MPSKQRLCQLRHVAAGRCRACGKKRKPDDGGTSETCGLCAEKPRIRARNAYRLARGIPLDAPVKPCGAKRGVRREARRAARSAACAARADGGVPARPEPAAEVATAALEGRGVSATARRGRPSRRDFAAYRLAFEADAAYSAELQRVFGKAAGEARYDARGESTPKLRRLAAAKLKADAAKALAR